MKSKFSARARQVVAAVMLSCLSIGAYAHCDTLEVSYECR